MHPATINNDISMNRKGCVSFVLRLVYIYLEGSQDTFLFNGLCNGLVLALLVRFNKKFVWAAHIALLSFVY